jgi:REP element-mobilizing transposase RayT
MPRQARIDAPGAVHHIMARGIEKRKIFFDDKDRDAFISRLGELVSETRTLCYAWALIPNHFHLLLKTGRVPLATLMRRLLTGYAIGFNRRHRRSGYVFQNRYKSILCEQDVYLKELVRYIHLNPLRARLVKDIKALDTFAYCGHSYLMGRWKKNEWQASDQVLALFGDQVPLARRRYRDYIKKGVDQGQRDDLVGGGLVRSAGGWSALQSMRKAGVLLKSDERILGSSDFVNDVLAGAQEALEKKYALKALGVEFTHIVEAVSELMSVSPQDLFGPRKERVIVKARILVCYWAVTELGMSMTEIGKRLGISVSTASVAVKKGRQVVGREGLKLAEILNV